MNQQSSKENNYNGIVLLSFLSVLIFAIYYRYVLSTVSAPELSDFGEHTLTASNIRWDTFFACWLERPYILWHLTVKANTRLLRMPIYESASFASAMYLLICVWVTFYLLTKIVKRYIGESHDYLCATAAVALNVVQPLYVTWFNENQTLGQFSINPLYNPTHMAVKWVGLIAFMSGIDLFYLLKNDTPVFFSKHHHFILAVSLFVSTLYKPTFAYMLMPALFVYAAIEFFKVRNKEIFIKVFKIGLTFVPAFIYILIEFVAFYFWGDTNGDSHIFMSKPFEAWKNFSPNIVISIILEIAAPIWIVATHPKTIIKRVEGEIGLICYFTGLLEFAFFAESGYKFEHLNFAWEYMSGMLILFVVAIATLIISTASEKKDNKWEIVAIAIGWILFFLQLYAGFYYINPYMYII